MLVGRVGQKCPRPKTAYFVLFFLAQTSEATSALHEDSKPVIV